VEGSAEESSSSMAFDDGRSFLRPAPVFDRFVRTENAPPQRATRRAAMSPHLYGAAPTEFPWPNSDDAGFSTSAHEAPVPVQPRRMSNSTLASVVAPALPRLTGEVQRCPACGQASQYEWINECFRLKARLREVQEEAEARLREVHEEAEARLREVREQAEASVAAASARGGHAAPVHEAPMVGACGWNEQSQICVAPISYPAAAMSIVDFSNASTATTGCCIGGGSFSAGVSFASSDGNIQEGALPEFGVTPSVSDSAVKTHPESVFCYSGFAHQRGASFGQAAATSGGPLAGHSGAANPAPRQCQVAAGAGHVPEAAAPRGSPIAGHSGVASFAPRQCQAAAAAGLVREAEMSRDAVQSMVQEELSRLRAKYSSLR